MPWLVCTAYIHSIMIQEKRGMLKVWNASLVLLTGIMAIVGDFLVRSGILSSIHAFVSDPTLNISFVALISLMVVGSVWLVTWRRDRLTSDHKLDSLISREGVFLLQNLVLVALTAVIFWLTFFPLISEAITGTQISVGPPVFARFVVPLALVVVALSGIGPIIAWRRVTPAKLRRAFAFPVTAGLGTLLVLAFVPGVTQHGFAYVMFGLGAFVVATVAQEFFRGTRARRAMTGESAGAALLALVRAQPATLRRLHRPRRRGRGAGRGGCVDVVPASAHRDAAARPERPRRRLRHQVRAPDRQRHRPEDLASARCWR